MRRPIKAPQLPSDLWARQDDDAYAIWRLSRIVRDNPYLHWEDLRHRIPPDGASVLQWWFAHKTAREPNVMHYPQLRGYGIDVAKVTRTATIEASLARFDRALAGKISHPDLPIDEDSRGRYISSSLIEEAIHSSLFEGAVSTREVAKEMLRAGRDPVGVDERMIVNNYRAMTRIRELAKAPLSVGSILEIHSILVDGTLKDPSQAGRFQTETEERVVVWDALSRTALHTPPPAIELNDRMSELVEFANAEDIVGDRYIHPIIRAILIHFQIGFIHPFADGNGRTARALFYWAMLRRGYWLTEFLSISRPLLDARSAYVTAYLHSETDAQDVTYFVLHQLDVIDQALAEFEKYVIRKKQEIAETRLLSRSVDQFNYRQLALLGHALKNPDANYTHESHARSHEVTHVTARTDLGKLSALGLLIRRRIGQRFSYSPAENLRARLERLQGP